MNRHPDFLALKEKVTLFLVLFLLPSLALATDGMYLAGYGTEAMGRGGAGIAVADRALGLQFNPAGISQLQGNHLSLDLQVLMPSLHYNDAPPLSNDVNGANRNFYMPSFAYVRGGLETPWTWGIGLVSQGGMGATFVYNRTPFGTRDQTYSQVRFATLTPCVAYSFNNSLSLGLSANIGWSDIVFRFWPDTSFFSGGATPVAFFGPKLVDPASTFNYSFRLGAMWRVHPRLQIGAEYQNKTHSDYKGGTLGLDMSAIGLGEVRYDATVSGFTWPEQYGVGVQIRPAEKWVMALDVKRYNWSNAIDVIEVKGTNPNNPGAAAEVTLPFVFHWKNQTVYALGGEWRASDDVTVRAGYNYGKNPVPDDTLNPLFPAITEKHATAGLGWNLGASTLNFAVERTFSNTQTNNNPDPAVNPFGPGATVEHSQWTVAVGLTRAFGRH